MSVSRRLFVGAVGVGTAGILSEGFRGSGMAMANPVMADTARAIGTFDYLRLSLNENPMGPSEKARKAIVDHIGLANRYLMEQTPPFLKVVAKVHGIDSANVMVGDGSGPLLSSAIQAFVTAARPLVTCEGSYEQPTNDARKFGLPSKTVPLDAKLRFDLDALAVASRGAGLVYICNPNNPTSTVRGAADIAAFVEQVGKTSPETYIIIDEAYFEYVADPSYRTAIPLAMSNPKVIVSRTFSKLYGLAGMRIGYFVAQPETNRIVRTRQSSGPNQLGLAAASAAITDMDHIAAEKKRNAEARGFTTKFFEGAGYKVAGADANFIFVDVRRDVKKFNADCAERNVRIGRAFPPYDTHARITIGTLADMEKAAEVFKTVLATA